MVLSSASTFALDSVLAGPMDAMRLTALDYNFIAKSMMERMATPVGPFASHGFPSSTQQVAAMSRCTHGVSSANSLMNHAAVIAPPPLPVPVLRMSAMVLLIISSYSSSMGMGHIFSPAAFALSRN